MKRGAAWLLVGVVVASALLAVGVRADVPALSDAEADALEETTATEPIVAASSAPAPAAAAAAPADYAAVAGANEARPEPVPPPRPHASHEFHPAPPPTAKAASEATQPSLVATAASTSSASSSAASASTAVAAKANSGAAVASSMDAITKYNEFLTRNFRFAQSLTGLFHEFDTNGDGQLDLRTEVPPLVAAGTITQQHANVIAAWDLDGDKKLSEKEWVMGPLYVSLLQYHPAKKAEFERLVATGGDTSEITKIFARLAAGSAEDLPRFSEMHVAAADASGKSEEELHLDAEQELAESQAAIELAADDTARFAARHGRRRRRRGGKKRKRSYKDRQAMSNKAARAAELIALKRPYSKHGIPSEADEHCVMCQYVVQRIQKQLYFTLANSNDGFPADPNAEIPAKKMRQVNSQLLNRRGGKGLLRILSEDIVSDMCEADSMPELYYSACRKIDKAFPVLLDAIYFQFHSEAVCEEAKLCGRKTYFNQPTSVHLPSKSIVYNSGRGKCGLMGGARERANAFISAALCFASSMFVETEATTSAHSL